MKMKTEPAVHYVSVDGETNMCITYLVMQLIKSVIINFREKL